MTRSTMDRSFAERAGGAIAGTGIPFPFWNRAISLLKYWGVSPHTVAARRITPGRTLQENYRRLKQVTNAMPDRPGPEIGPGAGR